MELYPLIYTNMYMIYCNKKDLVNKNFLYVAIHSVTLLQTFFEKIQFQKICSSVFKCSMQKEQRLFGVTPVLKRKSLVTIPLWSNLNSKVRSFELISSGEC